VAHGVVENESIQVSTNGQDMIARRYLSVPASEFGVERRGRDLLGLHRYVLAEIAIGWIFEDVRGVMISSSSIVGFRKEGRMGCRCV